MMLVHRSDRSRSRSPDPLPAAIEPASEPGRSPNGFSGLGGPGGRPELLGVGLDPVDVETTLERVHAAIGTRSRLFLATANLNFVALAARDETFARQLRAVDLCVADGLPLVWLSRLLGPRLPERVAGADLVERMRRDTTRPVRVYLFGGPDGVAERAAGVLDREAGGLRCVGWQSPGMGTAEELSEPFRIELINAARPDFLFVSLGARKGQEWLTRNQEALEVPVICHLGAVLSFISGDVRRAPGWLQRCGLEWAWRIREEPALVRRYGADAATVARLVANDVGARPLRFRRVGRNRR